MYYITALIIIDMIIKAETNQNKLSFVILLCVQSVLLGTLQECSFCLEAVKGSQVKSFLKHALLNLSSCTVWLFKD